MKKFLTGACVLFIFSIATAQETISVMYYNLLNFPDVNNARISYLETICTHFKPDVLAVSELNDLTGSNAILNDALNVGGETDYMAPTFVESSNLNTMLYYNSAKLGFIRQHAITTALRDINEYVLYYKDPTLTSASDTAYLHFYVAHLKASDTEEDAADRAAETQALKSYLLTLENPENIIVGGDFNIYTSTEQAYINLTASNQANLHDVVGPGNYSNNNMYAMHFTQSTRTDSFDGGVTGGMDDRFDYILFSDDILYGNNGVKYIPNSYKALGQDGLRWNKSLIDPANTSLPTDVINAMYFMSDHIPVYMEIEAGGDVSVSENELENKLSIYPNPVSDKLVLNWENEANFMMEIYSITGNLVMSQSFVSSNDEVNVSLLEQGTYLVKCKSSKGAVIKKIIIK